MSLIWIVLQPLADLRRACAQGCDPALTTLFVQIWLFGLCLAGFESVFFGGGSALWFLMIVAIVGLRFQAIASVARIIACCKPPTACLAINNYYYPRGGAEVLFPRA